MDKLCFPLFSLKTGKALSTHGHMSTPNDTQTPASPTLSRCTDSMVLWVLDQNLKQFPAFYVPNNSERSCFPTHSLTDPAVSIEVFYLQFTGRFPSCKINRPFTRLSNALCPVLWLPAHFLVRLFMNLKLDVFFVYSA